MWRSQALCERLYVNRVLKRGSQILIVGGGVSGMVAALAALSLGAKVTLVERSSKLASRQADCYTRTICPTTFDFPFAHWDRSYYPISGHRAKIPWRRNGAAAAQSQWVKLFNSKVNRRRPKINLLFDAKLSQFAPDAGGVSATIEGFSAASGYIGPQHQDFALAILCLGPGTEKPSISGSKFCGHNFWDASDPLFDFADVPTAQAYAETPVLLVGGGDGGLGDLVGLLTGQREFAHIVRAIGFTAKDRDEIHQIRLSLNANYQVGCERSEHRIFSAVQQDSVRLADALWDRATIRNSVTKLLRPNDQRPFVQLVMPCYHFRFGYVANRIVAQLFIRALSEDLQGLNGNIAPIRMGAKLVSISSSSGHVCTGDCQLCSQAWHTAVFEPSVCPGIRQPPKYIAPYRVDAPLTNSTSLAAPCQTVTLSLAPMECRRILLRFRATHTTSELVMNYGFSQSLADTLKDRELFRLVTPYYPV